jgi:hypothetical protein
VFIRVWLTWGGAALLLRGVADPALRRRAMLVVFAGSVAILALVVVCVPTVLSSDLYRQAAYGRMVVVHGLNPYASPVDAIPNDPLFALANQRHTTTHYGAAYTLLSVLAAALAPSTALGAALAWKAMSALAAVGCAALAGPVVRALGGSEADGQNAQLWLAWNPLMVIEAGGSAHIEPIMMLAALGGLLLWRQERQVRGTVALVASTLTKWVSGLLFVFVFIREIRGAAPGGRLRTFVRLAGAAGLTIAVLYLPFVGGLAKPGGISEFAARGASAVGNRPPIPLPQWALLAGFAVLVIGTTWFATRGEWPRLVATVVALMLVFVLFVNPWPFPWYFLSPIVLAAVLPRGRAGFVLRGLSAGFGAMALLLYLKPPP